MRYVMAIDQGTTSSRAILFDEAMTPAVASAQEEFPQHYPASGWVEHDPGDLWSTTAAVCRGRAGEKGHLGRRCRRDRHHQPARDHRGLGRATGEPLHNAIVWQDRRTADFCRDARGGPRARPSRKPRSAARPVFLGDEAQVHPGRDRRARPRRAGEVLFGTVDTWLIWKLTGGKVHVTDATNACRTMLYDIEAGDWSDEVCALFDIPRAMLPEIRDSRRIRRDPARPLRPRNPHSRRRGRPAGGDRGQACFEPGMMKSTYGTGCFALLNTGDTPFRSQAPAAHDGGLPDRRQAHLALEGAIFIAGAVVQWLRDGLKIIREASETQPLAEAADPGQDVVLVPAFTGLGAPYWNPDCRGAMFGLTRNSGPAEFARKRRSKAWATRPRTFSKRCRPTGRTSAVPTCCASMAA